MKLIIPPQDKKTWTPSYVGEWFGHFIRSWNLDFAYKQGYIAVSPRIYPHTTNQDIVGMTVPTAFLYSNPTGAHKYWCVADKIYVVASYTQLFVVDTLTNSPTGLADADMVVHGRTSDYKDKVIVSGTGTDLHRFDYSVSTSSWKNNWWTDTVANGGLAQPALISGVSHILFIFGNAPILFITDDNRVHSVNTPNNPTNADVRNSRLVFSSSYTINWAKVTKDRIYFGLLNKTGLGFPSLVAEYDPFNETVRVIEVQEGVTIGYIYNNNLSIITQKGNLKEYTGSSFKDVPGGQFSIYYKDNYFLKLPHRNGIDIFEGRPHFLIGGFDNLDWTYYGGVWMYEPDFQRLSHRYSFAQDKTTQNDFGNGIFYNGGWGALFKIIGRTFFAGVCIALTGGGAVRQGVWGTIGAGAISYSNRGFFIIPKILSSEINNIWRNVLIKYNPNDYPWGIMSGNIILKYKTTDNPKNVGVVFTGTWITATTFTLPESFIPRLSIGNEIFIVQGQGSGMLAHITNITASGNPRTITIDEGLSVSPSGDFNFTADNWIKIRKISDNTKQNYLFDIPEGESEWVQLKIELRIAWLIKEIQIGVQPNLIIEKS